MTSNLRRLVDMIPTTIWIDILANNMIVEAKPNASNQWMIKLTNIYNVYLDPNLSVACDPCRSKVLNNFRQMQNIAMKKLKDLKLLDA